MEEEPGIIISVEATTSLVYNASGRYFHLPVKTRLRSVLFCFLATVFAASLFHILCWLFMIIFTFTPFRIIPRPWLEMFTWIIFTANDGAHAEMKPIGVISCLLIYDICWRPPSAALCRMSTILCLVLYSNKNIDNEAVKSVPTMKKNLVSRSRWQMYYGKDTFNLLTFHN